MRNSRIPDFYKLSVDEKIRIIKNFSKLNEEDLSLLKQFGYLEGTPYLEKGKKENVVGSYLEFYRLVPNFRINGKEYIVPMVTEEDTVAAGAANIARLCREGKGIIAKYSRSIMVGQVPIIDVENLEEAKRRILVKKEYLKQKAGRISRHYEVKDLGVYSKRNFLVTELYIDTKDAMGARRITEMCETIRKDLEELTGGTTLTGIISNYDVGKQVDVNLKVRKKLWGGKTVRKIVELSKLAEVDEKRAATNNKGMMNGIIAVARATGQDDRAISEAIYSYAYKNGIKPMSKWCIDKVFLRGKLRIPMHVGTVGGATNHPMARLSLKILRIKHADELARVMGTVGLVQNLAALHSLVKEGISEAHRRIYKEI